MNYKILLFAVLSLLFRTTVYGQSEKQFASPSDEYKPWVFWSWLNDMITKKGIHSDLQEFKKFGLGGTLIMLIGSETQGRQMYENHGMPNPIISQTPEFFDMWKYAAEESGRLGLTISTQLGPGWCHSGGPWVTPDQAVQHLAYSELQIKGNNRVITLDMDQRVLSDAAAFHSKFSDADEPKYVDIALREEQTIKAVRLHPFDNKGERGFGFPSRLKIEVASKPDFSDKKIFYSSTSDLENPGNTGMTFKGKKIKGRYIRVTATKNYEVQRGGKPQYLFSLAEIEVIADGRNVAQGASVETSGSIEDFGYQRAALTDGFSMTTPYPGPAGNRLTLFRPGQQYYTSDIAVVAFPDKEVVDPGEIVDLTPLDKGGEIEWMAPEGDWIVRRYAMRDAQAYNRPPPVGGRGLESDKLDKDAVDAMFAGMVGRYIKESPQLVGNTIKAFEADSWEVGNPEWSPKFKEEFIKRRGYDPTPWLIAYTGQEDEFRPWLTPYRGRRIMGNKELTSRFVNDMYITQTDLFAENFFTHLADKADSLGMDFMTEPYIAPFDPVRMAGRVQVPMCEFWVSTEMMHTVRWASSAANTYGKKVVAAEGFTGRWNDGNWKMDPYAIKRAGDLAFANGVNKMFMHASALQPWGKDLKPGMPMYFWGTIFIPGQTWWEPARSWTQYLSRCQYMLQQGKNVADVVGLMPTLNWRRSMPEGLHKKYNYDLVSEEILLNDMDYRDGFFTLSSGARYRVLMLPKTDGKMAPELLRKLIQLAKKGGTIVCQEKPSIAPGLSGYPQIDTEVQKLAGQLWGKVDGKTVFENQVGAGKLIWMSEIWKDTFGPEREYFLKTRTKGREFWDNSAVTTHWSDGFTKLLKTMVQPDVEVLKAGGKAMAWGGRPETEVGTRQGEDAIAWTHRRNGDTDIYFVSSQVASENRAELLFRVQDKVPVIWNPEDGKQYTPADWSMEGNRTKVTIPFTPFGSLFILFKPKGEVSTHERYRAEVYTDSITLDAPWQVRFPEGFGAPASAELHAGSWTESDVFGIKYFSGTATYETTVRFTKKQLKSTVSLDLGKVKNLAEIIINGEVMDTLWKPPFVARIDRLLKPGENTITLKITNTWWNRRVGDQQLPEDLKWRDKLQYAGDDYRGYELAEFPEWVWTGAERPSKERVTFSPWRFVEKDSPLEPSGLIGPVRFLSSEKSFPRE